MRLHKDSWVLLFVVCLLSWGNLSRAAVPYEVDLFGDSDPIAQRIVEKYRAPLIQQAKQFDALLSRYQLQVPVGALQSLSKQRQAVCQQIQKEGHYAFVDVGMVAYPDEPTHYLTIEVVRSNEPDRLRWVHTEKPVTLSPRTTDVVQVMLDYLATANRLILQGKNPNPKWTCRHYHCIYGFEGPALKPYEARLNQGVLKEKAFILKALNGADLERSKAAIFVVGHGNNPQQIIDTLLPFVTAADVGQRNNAIRVIGEVVRRAKYYHLDPKPFITLLRSPYETDRNKSLLVLATLVKDPKARQVIARDAKAQLVLLAQLKQPNNRLPAADILAHL